jgi:hypothetical protein
LFILFFQARKDKRIIEILNNYRNPSLGLATEPKARACKGAGQEEA